ncbi:hypothetical protein MAPG_00252 [Magnaporthiopsis poae ATCC 64411]|uniref:Uncharacterized protein n=1 Tax=Magnaporthiopsis poae (strain ATCC 64411 / 73-15) TaxID=644358 RepID=A0A0C4DKH9_MAGP6|nr:hypothetical protein MAPG_00252 [Magnaporthiopsis poae ATCC 64411]
MGFTRTPGKPLQTYHKRAAKLSQTTANDVPNVGWPPTSSGGCRMARMAPTFKLVSRTRWPIKARCLATSRELKKEATFKKLFNLDLVKAELDPTGEHSQSVKYLREALEAWHFNRSQRAPEHDKTQDPRP